MRPQTNGALTLLLLLGCGALPAAGSEPARDFPCWRGANGDGCSQSGAKLIDDISKARLVWKSEHVPGVYGTAIQTGNAGVTVGDGKVLLVYHEPNDDVADEEFVKRTLDSRFKESDAYNLTPEYAAAVKDPAKRAAFARKKFGIAADDVILCLDAETGKTLWKAVFEKKGINPNKQVRGPMISAKCGPHVVPCIAYGKVYAFGSTGRVYCVDAKDGKPVWESDLGATFKNLEAIKEQCRQSKTLKEYDRHGMATGPTFANGVIVAFDDAGGLIGFDPNDGKKLWTAKTNAGKYKAAPIRWVAGGREYVVSGGTCVEPKTGKVLWQVAAGTCVEGGTAVVGENRLIWGSKCYEITPEKAELAWSFPHTDDVAKMGGDYSVEKGPHFRNGTTVIQNGYCIFRTNAGGQGMAGSRAFLVKLADGRIAASHEDPQLGIGTENGSFAGGDGRFFLECHRDSNDKIAMFNCDPATFSLKCTALPTPRYAMSCTPTYAGGRLYLRFLNHIACYDLRAE
jgi:outer membrane protein assembly factor BamB